MKQINHQPNKRRDSYSNLLAADPDCETCEGTGEVYVMERIDGAPMKAPTDIQPCLCRLHVD